MPASQSIRITDDLGDELVLPRPPERIVPSITETRLPGEPPVSTEADRDEIAAILHERADRARILLVHGSYLTWFGIRTLVGIRHLMGETDAPRPVVDITCYCERG